MERRLSARLANPNWQRSRQIKFRGGQGGPEPELLVRRPPPTLDIDIAIGLTPCGWHSIIRSVMVHVASIFFGSKVCWYTRSAFLPPKPWSHKSLALALSRLKINGTAKVGKLCIYSPLPHLYLFSIAQRY